MWRKELTLKGNIRKRKGSVLWRKELTLKGNKRKRGGGQFCGGHSLLDPAGSSGQLRIE